MLMLPPDTPKYQGWRYKMVRQLRRERGIADERVLAAMEKLPRHYFCTETLLDGFLYDIDKAFSIGCGQTISAPATVAKQSQLLALKPGMKVLEIGTGSGYQAAVLCEMGARVYTIERQHGLFVRTKELLHQLGYTAKCFLGDGFKGITEVNYAPYDRVIVTCGAPFIPEEVMAQLRIGGTMVIPVGEGEQKMLLVTKEGESPDQWKQESFGGANFVPMLEGRNF